MRYLFDSSIVVEFLRRQPERLVARFNRLPDDDVVISAIVLSELLFGIKHSAKPIENKKLLDVFLEGFVVLNYDEDAAEHYAEIRQYLESIGKPIGPMDTLIAAHARSLGVVLVTNNLREFDRVPQLLVESW
jgi:tRNA(fMet)-specific endonuclease VapC